MNTPTVKRESTSIRDIEWDARQRKVVSWSFVITGLGIALVLGLSSFL